MSDTTEIVNRFFPLIFYSKWADDDNAMELAVVSYVLFLVTLFIFLLTEPGLLMTYHFDLFGIELNQCDWYSLPIKLQRMYLQFSTDTQNPIKISGYADISCERDTAKLVVGLVPTSSLT